VSKYSACIPQDKISQKSVNGLSSSISVRRYTNIYYDPCSSARHRWKLLSFCREVCCVTNVQRDDDNSEFESNLLSPFCFVYNTRYTTHHSYLISPVCIQRRKGRCPSSTGLVTSLRSASHHPGFCSDTKFRHRNARAQHLDMSRCWDVSNFCPLMVNLLYQQVVELL